MRGDVNLNLRQVLRPLLELHLAQRHADGAGRDEHDSVAILAELDGGFDDYTQNGKQGLVGALVDDGACSCAELRDWLGLFARNSPSLMTMVRCFCPFMILCTDYKGMVYE